MHDFLHLGFNQDEEGQRVFDGMLNWVGAASGGFFNYRFAQPGRNHWQHIGRWYPERQFPFTNEILFDPITGNVDGRLRRCRSTNTCPKIFETGSANEYWTKGGSLLHTDTIGNDLRRSGNVRMYLLSSLAHVALSGPGICQQPRNPLVPNRALRALLVALDEWVSEGRTPPRSRVPQQSEGTLVPSRSQKRVGFPKIPGVTFRGLTTTGDLFDYGPAFDEGILTTLPPGSRGFSISGVRSPDRRRWQRHRGHPAPGNRRAAGDLYRAGALRAAAFAGDDLCDMAGQKIDFFQTKADRLAAGDPRPSIEERYPTHKAYVGAVSRAAIRLYRHRLLLDEDVSRYLAEAAASNVGK